jgi:hypothetical protein
MSDIGLFEGFGHDLAIWLAVTALLGGAAAVASGRALARAWRPFGKAVAYCALLAGASNFLCYALFQVSALPAWRIAENLASGQIADAALMLSVFALTFASLLVFAFIGWRVTRSRQMREQYPFLDRLETGIPPDRAR